MLHNRVLLPHFEHMFGGPLDDKTKTELDSQDWGYRLVMGIERDRLVLDLLRRAEKRYFSIAGENVERWQKGWSENLEEFRRTGDVAALTPKYIRPAKYLRLEGQFITPADPMFERNWYRIFRGWFARRYLSEFDAIFEFGCGSGHNVAWLAQEFPDKYIHGFDWAEASVQILRELKNPKVGAERFDFFYPPAPDYPGARFFMPNSAVLTIGALEQTGTRWGPFLNFLRRTRPAMCFHIEPIVEWYDSDSLVDYTAIKAHEARGFWKGFVGEVAPIRKHRTGFGSLLLEGYSQCHWSPAHIDSLEGAP